MKMLFIPREITEVFWKYVENLQKFFEKFFALVAEAFKNFSLFLESEEIQAFLKTKKTHYFRYMAWIKSKNHHRSVIKNVD